MRSRMLSLRAFPSLLAVALACVLFVASRAGAESGEPKYGGALVFALPPNSISLDPPFQLGDPDVFITQATYDNLLMVQPDLSVKPELATSWEHNEDLSSYTFHLRQGVKFHHGKEFKAEDVVFTFERLLDPELDSPARSIFEVIEEIVVIDDYTVRFDLVAPNGFFPESLSIFQARIVPSDVDVERLTLEEFGTGPFMLAEYLPNERATLVRNPDYWEEGKPYLDELVMLNISEVASRDEALKSGDADIVYQLSPQSIPGLEAHPETTVLKATSFSYIGLPMPTEVAPFDNKLVRKAMQAATDRQAINQAALLGLGVIGRDHPIHPDHPVFAPSARAARLRPRAGGLAAGAGRLPGRDRRHPAYRRYRDGDHRAGGGVQGERRARRHPGQHQAAPLGGVVRQRVEQRALHRRQLVRPQPGSGAQRPDSQ